MKVAGVTFQITRRPGGSGLFNVRPLDKAGGRIYGGTIEGMPARNLKPLTPTEAA